MDEYAPWRLPTTSEVGTTMIKTSATTNTILIQPLCQKSIVNIIGEAQITFAIWPRRRMGAGVLTWISALG